MLNIILLGPPGSGKGTQAEFIVKTFELSHISTGECLRNEIKSQTELGTAVQDIISKGELVPDEIVNAIIANHIKNNLSVKGFLFDGYPRTQAQAQHLDNLLNKLNIPISFALNIDVADEELVRRIVYRGQLSGRADDTEDTAYQRIKVYNEKTKVLLDFYQAQDKLVSINGHGTIEENNGRVNDIICKF
ncbi:adenylate kinase [Bacteroidia bacterium]|nr:adenylate kinase [Bacteroidia bacterium]